MTNIPDNVRPIFERWYLNKYDLDYYDTHRELQMEWFWHLPFEMQSGVWIKFCEDMGVTTKNDDINAPIYRIWGKLDNGRWVVISSIKYDNQISAINKALELINKTIES